MVDDFWSMDRCSQDSDGKGVVWRQNSRRSKNPGKYTENSIFPEDSRCQKMEWRWATGGPHHPLARAALGHASRWCGRPGPLQPLPSGVYQPHETLRLGEQPQKDSAASAGRKTPREKDLSSRQISAGGIPSQRGKIVAINTTIKLDFIGIITISIIISTSTIITTSYRCNNWVEFCIVLRGNFPGVDYSL